jgi:hypothetical protein
MALRWKNDPRPTGLRSVIAGPQGSTMRDGDDSYASTNFAAARYNDGISGWYWVARNEDEGIPLKNTCETLVADEATAKAEAMAYVRACLAQRKSACGDGTSRAACPGSQSDTEAYLPENT